MAQKFYEKAGVQASIVGGIALIIGVLIPNVLQIPNLKQDISNLERKLQEKQADVQRLETLLAPFRTIALEKYAGPETEALSKLAGAIRELQALDTAKTKKIAELESQLDKTSQLAKPPILTLLPPQITQNNSGIIAKLKFRPSKNEHLGLLVFYARLPINTSSRIVDFWPSVDSGAFESGPDSKYIAADGKSARLVYSLLGAGFPSVDLKLSNPENVEISGEYIEKPLTVGIGK